MTAQFKLRGALAGVLSLGLIAGGAVAGATTAQAADPAAPAFFVFNGEGSTLSDIKAQEVMGKSFKKSDQLIISASKSDPLAPIKPADGTGVTKAYRFVAPVGQGATQASWKASFVTTVDPAAGLLTDNFTLEDHGAGASNLAAGKYDVGIAFAKADDTIVSTLARTIEVAANGTYTLTEATDFDTSVVTAAKPTITSSKVAVGQKLTAKAGNWGPTGVALAYQWLADGTAVPGATSASYTLKAADLGKRFSVRVTGSFGELPSKTETSNATVAVAKGALSAATPKVSGTYKVKKTLKVKAGTWGPSGVKLSYQWLRGGKAIKGATKTSYKLGKADKGKKISVKVTGTLSGYTTVAKTSSAKKVK